MNYISSFFLLLTCGILISCREKAQQEGPIKVEVGKEAPDFKFRDLATDKASKLSDFRGKVVIAKFWWSKCPLCNIKMDHMQTFIDEHREWEDDVVYLAISVDPTIEGAKRHVAAVEEEEDRSWSGTLNSWHDSQAGESPIYLAYAAETGIPVSYVIDRRGKITAIDSPKSPDELDLDVAVRGLLAP